MIKYYAHQKNPKQSIHFENAVNMHYTVSALATKAFVQLIKILHGTLQSIDEYS